MNSGCLMSFISVKIPLRKHEVIVTILLILYYNKVLPRSMVDQHTNKHLLDHLGNDPDNNTTKCTGRTAIGILTGPGLSRPVSLAPVVVETS